MQMSLDEDLIPFTVTVANVLIIVLFSRHSSAVNNGALSQPKPKKTPLTASSATVPSASPQPHGSSLLDAPLNQMIADPWAKPTSASHWGDPVDTVTSSQSDVWSSRHSPSQG